MNEDRINYTSAAVVESHKATSTEVSAHYFDLTEAWGGVAASNKPEKVVIGTTSYSIVDAGSEVADTSCSATVNGSAWKIAFAAADTKFVADAEVKVGYKYDNVVIPQDKIPSLTASMKEIELVAKARRIAIYYSNMAAFQAKTEMGIDLGEVLATQACGELAYETDSEVVKLLDENAGTAVEGTTFNKRCPWGVGTKDHYAKFAEVIENGSQIIYDRTQKHAANWMLISSNIKPILVMIEGFKAASTAKINGPYFCGELNGIKVYVSPAIEAGRFVLGYNAGDFVTSAAVYAPYMAIVPTQLLGFADGGMSQGFSSLYDLKMLNPDLLVAGKVVDNDYIVQTHAA